MEDPDSPAILCLAHLGWDFVRQRPQQIMSRLARSWPVAYVNEPSICHDLGQKPAMAAETRMGGLSAWQPLFPDRPSVIAARRHHYALLVRELLVDLGWAQLTGDVLRPVRPLIVRFRTPTPLYLLEHLPHCLAVYDVMDELANFKGAAADLRQREQCLLAHVDLVFAGGRSLYAARKQRHAQVHVFPSSVDAVHFGQAQAPVTPIASEIAGLRRPILGYYGVIDERLDLNLVAALADARPDWSIVLVGPVATIEPGSLPRRHNLHYPGQQPYDRLPAFLKGFDVCLMPFRLNAATRFISPTKALEYMAAHKAIVSTPVPDVVANWATAVHLAPADGLKAAVEAALQKTPAQRDERVAVQQAFVDRGRWEHLTAGMRQCIERALAQWATFPVVEAGS